MTTGLSKSEINLLRPVFQGHAKIEEVRLFGSRAKGTHGSASDIDLAVLGDIDDLEAETLAAQLDELPLPYRFDVIAMRTLRDPAVREHVERVGQTLYRRAALVQQGGEPTGRGR